MQKELIEIRWHGRGGQGAKTGAKLVAEAAMEEGKHVQSFPEYGPEREGAPIRAYDRISDLPVNIHTGITNPDIVIVVDPSLIESEGVTQGLKENGIIIVNTEKSPAQIKERLKFDKGKVFTIDATRISLEKLGKNLPNTPLLGALATITGIFSIDIIKEKIRHQFAAKLSEEKIQANIDVVDIASKEVKSE